MAPVSKSNSRGKRARTASESSPLPPPAIDDANANNPASLGGDSPSIGFQSATTPPPPPPRRSLRLSAASAGPSPKVPNPNPNLSVTPRGTAPNAEEPDRNSSVAAVASARRRSGRLRRSNPSSADQNQDQEEEEEEMIECADTEKADCIETVSLAASPSTVVQISSSSSTTTGDADGVGGDDDEEEEEEEEEEEKLPILRSTKGGDKGKGKGTVTITINEELRGRDCRVGFSDKGKAKIVIDVDSDSVSLSEFDSEEHAQHNAWEEEAPAPAPAPAPMWPLRREAERNRAIELAPKYAYFRDEEAVADSEDEADDEPIPDDDWPGPFSTAMKLIEQREAALRAREEAHSSSSKGPDSSGSAVPISWTPSRNRRGDDAGGSFSRKPHSLESLSMKALVNNAERFSLDGLPDAMRNKLVAILCNSRRMTAHHLSELVQGAPEELRLSDCSWATDREFEEIFTHCNTSSLKELQLDLCGRCLPDYVLRASLARAPNSLPSLTKLSLKGAYSLSDNGLAAIITSAPLLSSLNLSQCSLLTSEGISYLADNRGPSLRELYIDDCQNLSAMSILPLLKKAKCLEVLSMAGIPSVSNKFVRELITVCGPTIKELNFAGCTKLTSSAIKVIGENCPQLLALDIRNLTRLKDVALGHLANGCRDIRKLLLRRSSFSDEAIAAFVEVSGSHLTELSLNNIEKVGQQTAIAISQRCGISLKMLDLSFCRSMSDQALGLIVDSCSSLKTLKLFGCTQVTDLFLNGHSNMSVKIIGLGGNILDHIPCPDHLFLLRCV